MAIVDAPGSARTSAPEAACTASTCSGTPRSAHSSAIASTGCSAPVTLLAAITQQSASPGRTSSASAPMSTTPSAVTGAHATSPPYASSGSRTAGCSIALATTRPPAARRPSTARLSASDPPPVKATSPGAQPSVAATDSRAASSPARAARPAACGSDGLPKCSFRYGSIARQAAGDSGVVAAWSR